jgi:hypothetical protein
VENNDNGQRDNIIGSFVTAYAERDKNVDFSVWLAEKLQHEMPDMTTNSSQRLSQEIIEAVDGYDQTLNELNEAVDTGQSKDEWLVSNLQEACVDMPVNEAGNILQQLDQKLIASNGQLMNEDAADMVAGETADWNEYSIKNTAINIGQQAILSGLGVASNIIKANMESGESTDIGNVVGQVLQAGMDTAVCEVKSVVAGAMKTAIEKGLTDILPSDTPVGSICDMACSAVESAAALAAAATGKITLTEALDKASRSCVAAVCRFGSGALKMKAAAIPFVGPAIAWLGEGLFKHMESPQFANDVHNVVSNMARATWEGIKQKVRSLLIKQTHSVKEKLYS